MLHNCVVKLCTKFQIKIIQQAGAFSSQGGGGGGGAVGTAKNSSYTFFANKICLLSPAVNMIISQYLPYNYSLKMETACCRSIMLKIDY